MLLQKFPNRAEYLYKDLQQTAMGTKIAPTYATPVLGYLEHILYEQLLNCYGQEFASYVRQNWKRFLDDCFIIWNSDIPVEIFHTELNSLNDHIRFTINRSKIEMPFLDVLTEIYKNIFQNLTQSLHDMKMLFLALYFYCVFFFWSSGVK
jgi:hypothetical protein